MILKYEPASEPLQIYWSNAPLVDCCQLAVREVNVTLEGSYRDRDIYRSDRETKGQTETATDSQRVRERKRAESRCGWDAHAAMPPRTAIATFFGLTTPCKMTGVT